MPSTKPLLLTNPTLASNIDIDHVTHFLLELDALKRINRRSYVTHTTRKENSAEHSCIPWRAGLSLNSLSMSIMKLLKMALVHDLGEIDAGDTFLFANSRSEAHIEERAGIARLQRERGNGIMDLNEIWEEQETGSSKETQLIRVVDRLLPFLLNLNTNGKTWIDANVTCSQVAAALAFIKDSFPPIHDWLSKNIDYATRQGWLVDA
ncbi:LOW QUALITY PROTEIN: hydrolase [Psychrobacter sp. JCM 18903]|nr:LOW QUALITY PROTEIN: hydrolase [Psychrobacter sp. JCM 18903]